MGFEQLLSVLTVVLVSTVLVSRVLYVLSRTLRYFLHNGAANREESNHPLTSFSAPPGLNLDTPARNLTS
jgi:hypothetical protein